VSGVSASLGALSVGCGFVLTWSFENIISTLGLIFLMVGAYMMANSVLPTDRLGIRVLSITFTLLEVAIVMYVMNHVLGPNSLIVNPSPCNNASLPNVMAFCVAQSAQYCVDTLNFAACFFCMVWVDRFVRDTKGRCRPALYPRVMLARVWATLRVGMLVSGCSWFCAFWLRFAFQSEVAGAHNEWTATEKAQQASTCFALLFFAALSSEYARKAIQGLLAGSGTKAAEASAAASISAVMGGSADVRAALSAATRVFRSISFDELAEADFDTNAASTELNGKARPAQLGEIDFFLSHSWHDDHTAKWTALTRFAVRFSVDHDRMPVLWLDKACLNQEDIAGSLSHLPVHVAGCQRLVVIAGSTYSSRLWTLLELYVWVSMGKPTSEIRIQLIGKDTDSTEEVVPPPISPLCRHDTPHAASAMQHPTTRPSHAAHPTGHPSPTPARPLSASSAKVPPSAASSTCGLTAPRDCACTGVQCGDLDIPHRLDRGCQVLIRGRQGEDPRHHRILLHLAQGLRPSHFQPPY
jgi:hypothetical protein